MSILLNLKKRKKSVIDKAARLEVAPPQIEHQTSYSYRLPPTSHRSLPVTKVLACIGIPRNHVQPLRPQPHRVSRQQPKTSN